MDLGAYKDFAVALAQEAGAIMLDHFDTNVAQREKVDKTIVTIADEAINRMVIERVEERYPDHSVSGEEESNDKGGSFVWVCDPIDGTNLFARSIPMSVFSLALVVDGIPVVGVIYDPFMKRMYSAVQGAGAYCNGKRISVSKEELGRNAVVNVEWWSDAPIDLLPAIGRLAAEKSTYNLTLGSVAHGCCLVASGKYAACLFAGKEGKNVDIAAAKIIVEEAGGRVTDIDGKEQRYDTSSINGAIVSNGVVHEELIGLCAGYKP